MSYTIEQYRKLLERYMQSLPKQEPSPIDAFTVCVNYSDYLKETIWFNKPLFNSWTIITHKDDKDTIKLCREKDVSYVLTDRIYEDGVFCKGKAINDGILEVKPKDWICHVDADTIIPNKFKNINSGILQRDALYGMSGRYILKTQDEFDNHMIEQDLGKLEKLDDPKVYGYYQLWHSSYRPFYPEESHNAGLDDVLFTDSFQKQIQFNEYAFHLGPIFTNHDGRKSPHFNS